MIDDTTPAPTVMGEGAATETLVSGLEERGLKAEDAALAVAVVLESIIGAIQGLVLSLTMSGLSTHSLLVLGASLVDDIDAWYAGFKPAGVEEAA